MQTHPRRLLVFTGHFYPHPQSGGLEKYVEELYSRLAATGKYRVTIVTFEAGSAREEVYRGLQVVRLEEWFSIAGVFTVPTPQSLSRFRREVLPSLKPDIVVTQTRFFPAALVGALLARQQGIPHLHTEHGSDYVRHASAIVSGGAWLWDSLFGRFILRSAKRVTGVSSGVKDFVYRLAGREAVVAYNGVDIDFWDPALARQLPTDLVRWLKGRKPFLYVGRLMRVKGYEVLIEAVRGLSLAEQKKIAIVLVGSGPEEARMKQLIHDYGLEHVIRALGRQSPELVRDLLAVSIYVNPSFSAEGLQTTLLEAGAMNSWLITTDVSGAREVVSEPGIGEVVAQQDVAAFQASMQRALRDSLESQARASIIRRFGWPALVTQFDAILESMSA